MSVVKRNITRLAFAWHGWLGLTAGFFLLLFSLSGSLLMFRSNIDRWLHPDLHQLPPGTHTVSVDSMYRNIARTHPNLKKMVLHDFPVDRFDSYEFMIYYNQQHVTDNYLYFVFANPYTGQIIKEGCYQDITPSFFRWLYSFHYSLQLGMPGKLLCAVLGLVMLLSLITGTIIYRKHFWDALRFKGGLVFNNRRRSMSSLHRIVGVWSLVFNAVLFFTGFWMNKEHFNPEQWKLNPPTKANYMIPASIDSMVAASQRIVPGFMPIAVNVSCISGQDVLVRGRLPTTHFFLLQGKASSIVFDGNTGAFKKVVDIDKQPAAKRADWEIYQLHIGNYGGAFIRWLYLLLGLTPGFLSITGAYLWVKRKYKQPRKTVTK